jgi:hypothetical protein
VAPVDVFLAACAAVHAFVGFRDVAVRGSVFVGTLDGSTEATGSDCFERFVFTSHNWFILWSKLFRLFCQAFE